MAENTPITGTTKRLLIAGVLATPLFFAVALAQAYTLDGFDLTRHMISQLATGGLGWLQIANFVITGAMYVAAAVGLRRVLKGRGATWGPRLIAVFGGGLIAAGVFVTDPVGGYPVGAVEGVVSWHGILHGVAAMVSGLALLAATLFARRFLAERRRGWAAYSVTSGIVYLALPFVQPGLMSLLFALGSLVGWAWISAISVHAMGARPVSVAAPQLQNA